MILIKFYVSVLYKKIHKLNLNNLSYKLNVRVETEIYLCILVCKNISKFNKEFNRIELIIFIILNNKTLNCNNILIE